MVWAGNRSLLAVGLNAMLAALRNRLLQEASLLCHPEARGVFELPFRKSWSACADKLWLQIPQYRLRRGLWIAL